MKRAAGAILIAALALLLYRSTLLPGLDFGDTPSFQIMAGSPVVTPRDAYPLYFAIARPFVWTLGDDRAHALNLASAVEAAATCFVLVLLASELSGSLLAGMAAAGLFAGSYTFWSQAIIAEVYALHMFFIVLTLTLFLRWDRQPTDMRFACALAVYALGFGNHLTMILLAPGLALFVAIRRGWRFLFGRRTLVLAAVIAAAGSLQYLWNLRALWLAPLPPANVAEGLRSFWFDVTKTDWRTTMVLQVPSAMAMERFRMYVFDLHQQFGWLGLVLAALGVVYLMRTAARLAALLLTVYAVTLAFALSYNVGDAHVFLLPSHAIVAVLAAPGIVSLGRLAFGRRDAASVAIALAVTAVAAMRIYIDYPALDRSADRRPTNLLQELTEGVDDRHAVLLTDLNWQIENGLNYFAKDLRQDVAFARMSAVIRHVPELIRDNLAIGRQVVLTARAAGALQVAYGPLFSAVPDPSTPVLTLTGRLRDLPAGTRYTLCVLRPSREFILDESDLAATIRLLTGDRVGAIRAGDYIVVAGLVGEQPLLVESSNRPFRRNLTLQGVPVTVRMDSWLAFDTIRRMGFGHVIAARRHTLIVEQGISFVAFDATGHPLRTSYSAGIFAPQPRYLARVLP